VAGWKPVFEGVKMINRMDFFALLFFQIAITFALGQVLAKRNCADCNISAVNNSAPGPVLFDQLVLVDH
jgi:hypothetical protein